MNRRLAAIIQCFVGGVLMTIAVFHYLSTQHEHKALEGLAAAQLEFTTSYLEHCRQEAEALPAKRRGVKRLGEAIQNIEGKIDSIVGLKDFTIMNQHVLAPAANAFQGIQQSVKDVHGALRENEALLKQDNEVADRLFQQGDNLCAALKETMEVFAPVPWYRSSDVYISILCLLFGICFFLAGCEELGDKGTK